jgi:hypothetical protein
MNRPQPHVDPAATGRPILNEADIGSGEKTPAQKETEEMIRQIPPLPPQSEQRKDSGKPGAAPPAGSSADAKP